MSLATIPNEDKFDQAWRKAMREPMPIYFNPDGTRTDTAMRSRGVSREVSPRPTNPNSMPLSPLPKTSSMSRQSVVEIVNRTATFTVAPETQQPIVTINLTDQSPKRMNESALNQSQNKGTTEDKRGSPEKSYSSYL